MEKNMGHEMDAGVIRAIVSLDSFKGGFIQGIIQGSTIGVINRDVRSVDFGSCKLV